MMYIVKRLTTDPIKWRKWSVPEEKDSLLGSQNATIPCPILFQFVTPSP